MNIIKRKPILFISAIIATLSISQVSIANDCKGKEQSYCTSENSCRWVQSYKRKDGKIVKPYCRALSKKKVLKEQTNTLETKPETIKKDMGKAATNTKQKPAIE